MHIQLKPALRRLWRDPSSVQIGLSPAHGTVLEGLTSDDARFLDELREGVDPEEAQGRRRRLLDLLLAAGVAAPRGEGQATLSRETESAGRWESDAAVWAVVHGGTGDGWDVVAGRRAAHVAVRGAGRLGSTLAATLASCGVGHISVEDERHTMAADLAPAGAAPRDLGRLRSEVAAEAVRRNGGRAGPPDVVPPPGAPPPPDVVVLVDHGAADAVRADPLVAGDVAHLSVVVREDDVVVGPFVRPGHGPCLRCLDRHRTERDKHWPSLLAQVLVPPTGTPDAEETAVVTVAAGLAALQVLAHLDGFALPAALGATLEIELPDGLISRREWPAHPRCGCHWPPSPERANDARTVSARRGPPRAVTREADENE